MKDKFFTAPIDNGTTIGYIWQYFSAGVGVDVSFYLATPTTGETEDQFEAAGHAASVAYDTLNSYSIGNTQDFHPVFAAVAKSGSYADLLNLPVVPNSYQTIVSQTGSAAPVVTSGFTPINTYAGTPTFTWAHTATGTYTLTASAAVFDVTHGKTAVFVSASSSPINNVSAVVTSTTVITFTSSQLNLLALGVGNVDGLMSKTMIYVQTYA